MVFRIPSQLETFVPPPFNQRTHPAPWRGSLLVSGMRSSDRSSHQEICVTSVETDGDKSQQWPERFNACVLYDQRNILHQFRAWMNSHQPTLPICTFMPNRLRDANDNTVNQAAFRSLSRLLFEEGVVLVASWGSNVFPGAGMIIYPSSNSSAVLVGALFFDSSFPNFIHYTPPPMSPHSLHSPSNSQYGQKMTSVPLHGGPSLSRQAQSLSPHPNSPLVEQPIAVSHRQHNPYQYMVPRPGYPEIGQDDSAYGNYSSPPQNNPYS